ncbi:MAG: class II fructose-bisphosphate aldolase [Candidatus Aenigmatarchaeota archaeon]
MKLKEIIYDLNKNQAILHYNVSTLEQIKAGILAVKETKIPIIFGVSEGERKYLNPKLVKKIIDFYREEENLNDFIFLNADHSKTFESSKLALFLNYDEVLVDGSELSLEENIKIVKEIVSLRNENNLNVLIEGEVGFIGGKSELQKEEVEIKEEYLTKPEDALRFVEETKVDLLAVSIGNIHGILPYEPKLDFERGEKIAKLVKIPLVLHGASGISIENIKKCILIGFKIIHINTEFRKIWKEKLIERLNEDTVTPYKIYEPLVEELKKQIIKYQEEFFSK